MGDHYTDALRSAQQIVNDDRLSTQERLDQLERLRYEVSLLISDLQSDHIADAY